MVEGRETEYGFESLAIRPGDAVRATHFHMPNVNRIKGHPIGAGWTDNISWTVPVDDERFARFVVVLNHVTGAQAEAFRARRRAQLDVAGESGIISELGDRVLRGELRIEEIEDRTFIVQIQDYVSLLGQGVVADRAHEHAAQSDKVVALLRALWTRELRALAEDRPLKHWQRTAAIEATSGARSS
jgi:5,5'-dehydrodivanillate O-demethylase